MKTEEVLKVALLAGVGYALYTFFTRLQQSVGAPVGTVAATIWSYLHPTIQPAGNIVLPGGNNTLVPLSQTEVRTDDNHNVYALYDGFLYQLAPSDAQGNWPATAVE